jgi:hypothetical protein
MIHRDGHAGAIANGGVTDTFVRNQHDLLRRVGIQGWALRRLSLEDAVTAYLDGLNCPTCALVLPCGCSVQRVLAGQCPHGSAGRVHRIAHEIGYCSNEHPGHQGPPL